MTRRLMIASLLAALIVGQVPAAAHETFRIIGTITRVNEKKLDVRRTKDGKIISMAMNDEALITRDKVKVSATELKIGLSVVVDACGDSLKDLVVEEVKIVPPTTPAPKRKSMKLQSEI
jgi:5,10-methylene-tetrahydrofolate dehydrogenase/methenyl tetrahydrofolate cyclohydrolase